MSRGGWWKGYRHRFVPWLAINWSTRQVKRTNRRANSFKEQLALEQLHSLLLKLDHVIPATATAREWDKLLLQDCDQAARLAKQASEAMESLYGFRLELRASLLEGGGRGVFVSTGGAAPKDHIVGLYPGTVYLPFEPLLLQSLRNSFIFRCADGCMIDGKHRGLSRRIFRSCANRDVIGHSLSCDTSWLSTDPVSPLAVGQFVNNHTREKTANVEYIELSIPEDFPATLRRFIPNVFYSPVQSNGYHGNPRLMRTVALMSTRSLESEEELYSSYLTLVTS